MRLIPVYLLLALSLTAPAQLAFDDYFTDRTMRFDYLLAGNSVTTKVFPVSLREEPYWGGSLTNLTDKFNFGNFRYEVFDTATGTLIYSRGFCSLYQEWQTTAEAKKIEKSFQAMDCSANFMRLPLTRQTISSTGKRLTLRLPQKYPEPATLTHHLTLRSLLRVIQRRRPVNSGQM
jgi:hypothetical protein